MVRFVLVFIFVLVGVLVLVTPFDLVGLRQQRVFDIGTQWNCQQYLGARVDERGSDVFVRRLVEGAIAGAENVVAIAVEHRASAREERGYLSGF